MTVKVTQDGAALADALSAAAKQDNGGGQPTVSIAFNNPVGQGVLFDLPLAVLAAAAQNAPGTIVSLQTNDGEYSLPLNIIDFAGLVQKLGAAAADVTIQVNISIAGTDLSAKIAASAKNISASPLGNAVEFSVTAAGGGKTLELNQFGSTYVSRTLVLASSVDEAHSTVAFYEPSTGQFSFVPAVFSQQADSSTKVSFKRNGNSVYTVLTSTKKFSDVSRHWAQADIELLASKLVVNGVTDNTFAPDSSITRAEFAALLVRSLGLSANAAAASFADVNASDWYAGAIGAAVQAKLVEGFSSNQFKPNDTITREQMAVMIARALTAAGHTSSSSGKTAELLAKFRDKASISTWAEGAVAQATEAKVITGMTGDTFVPAAKASRAQAVVMLKRLLQTAGFVN